MSGLVHPGDDQTAGIALEDEAPTAFDYMAYIEICSEVRAAAKRVTGGNCAFADDDLAILEHLATRAVANGLTDRLNYQVTRRIAQSVPFAPKKVPMGVKVLSWFERAFHLSDGPKGQDEASPSNGMTP